MQFVPDLGPAVEEAVKGGDPVMVAIIIVSIVVCFVLGIFVALLHGGQSALQRQVDREVAALQKQIDTCEADRRQAIEDRVKLLARAEMQDARAEAMAAEIAKLRALIEKNGIHPTVATA